MDIGDLLTAVAKGYNDILAYSKVPVAVWQPQALSPQDQDFPVREPSGIISGGIDGARDELAGKADLVGLVLTVISNPKKTAQDLANFAKGLDWNKAGGLAKTMAQGMVGYDAAEFNKGGAYTGHATGKVGGTLVVSGTTLLAAVVAVPDLFENMATKLAALIAKIRTKLKSLNWADADIDKFVDDFGSSEDLLTKFDSGEIDLRKKG